MNVMNTAESTIVDLFVYLAIGKQKQRLPPSGANIKCLGIIRACRSQISEN